MLDGEDDRTLTRELDGIVEEVEQNLPQASLVADKVARQGWADQTTDLKPLLICRSPHDGQAIVDQCAGRERPSLKFDGSCLDLGEVQDVVDDREQGLA